jgi:hypothetical protein
MNVSFNKISSDSDYLFYYGICRYGKITKGVKQYPLDKKEFKIIIERGSGYINASDICRQKCKIFNNWAQLNTSKILIQKCKDILPDTKLFIKISDIDIDIAGTYIHRHLIMGLTSWVCPEFSIYTKKILDTEKINITNNLWKKEIFKLKNSKPVDLKKDDIISVIILLPYIKISNYLNADTPVGVIDILTFTHLIIVENSSQWTRAIGHIMLCSTYYPDRKKVLWLYGNEPCIVMETASRELGIELKYFRYA